MTSLFRARRRAEQLADALDSAGSAAVLDAQLDAELRQLVAVGAALRTAAVDVAPRPEFTADLRERLMAEAETALVAGAPLALPQRPRTARERRLLAGATAAVLLGGSAGMATAAQGSLPGEALYPIKRALEGVEAGLSLSSAGKGRDLLEQADTRLAEAADLLAGGAVAGARVPGTLADFERAAREGSALMFRAHSEDADADAVTEVRRFTASGITTLQELARTAPAASQDDLTAAAFTLRDIDEQARSLCGSCAPGLPELQVPGIFLASSEADRAFTVALREKLDNSHPVVVDPQVTFDTDGRGDSVGTGTDAPGVEGAPRSPLPAPGDPTLSDGLSASELPGGLGGTLDAVEEALRDTVRGAVEGGGDDSGDGSLGGTVGDTVEGTKKKVDDTVDGTTKKVEDTVGSVTDGLGGGKTLLPDPDLQRRTDDLLGGLTD